jgi:protein TonB
MKIKSIFTGILVLSVLMLTTGNINAQEKKEKKVFEKVEVMPKFQDQDYKQFNHWVMKNVKYPEDALKEGISGKVFVSFIINIEGDIEEVKIKKGVNKSLDEEVLRVVKSSPKWTPGYDGKKAVNVAMVIPVEFKLN